MAHLTLSLPWPPSMNNYWRHVVIPTKKGPSARTLISRDGREYRQTIVNMIDVHGPLTDRLSMRVDAYPPDRRRRDLDNILKPLLDALEAAGVYEDDSQIDELQIRRQDVTKGGMVYVVLKSI